MSEAMITRLSIHEYRQLPETLTPTELIDGVILTMPSPKHEHQQIIVALVILLNTLIKSGKIVVAPMDVILDDYNTVQPDVFWLRGDDSLCRVGDDGYYYGAPDLVCEVLSPSTALRDRADKFLLYEKHGVREYWLIDPLNIYMEVYRLQNGVFVRQGVYGTHDTFVSIVLDEQNVPVMQIFG